MPTSNGSVTFAYGKQEDYDKLEKNPSAIYFCEDTQRLFVGSTEFAPPVNWGEVYPVGRVIIWYDNEDHSNYLGLTWKRCLAGCAPVGIDSNDADFNTIGKQIGEKSHTLTSSEVPQLNTDRIPIGVDSSNSLATSYGSNGQPHNNIQPSEVVAFWRRV